MEVNKISCQATMLTLYTEYFFCSISSRLKLSTELSLILLHQVFVEPRGQASPLDLRASDPPQKEHQRRQRESLQHHRRRLGAPTGGQEGAGRPQGTCSDVHFATNIQFGAAG